MNLDLGRAFTRAQMMVNGLVAAMPSVVVARVELGAFLVLAAIVKGIVARLTLAWLQAPDVLLMEFASSSVNLRVRWWIAPPQGTDALNARDKVLAGTQDQLSAHGIDLPLTAQQILFHDQTEDSDGDRGRHREGWPAATADVPASRKVGEAIAQIPRSKARAVDGQ